jgi:AcrR family transcriptional regulator
MSYVADSPIFNATAALPRGPHSLTREQVAGSQRERLMAALSELLAERGWPGVTVGELARRATVSRATFYEHFADKEACLLAAYDRFAEAVLGGLLAELGEQSSWSDFIEAAIGGYVGVLERDTTAARAFLVEMESAGPTARRRRRDAIHGFAALIAERHRQIRAADPSLGPLPSSVYLTLVLGIRELMRDHLEYADPPRLASLVPELLVMMRAVIAGASAATA